MKIVWKVVFLVSACLYNTVSIIMITMLSIKIEYCFYNDDNIYYKKRKYYDPGNDYVLQKST
jgi:hypothetical protein